MKLYQVEAEGLGTEFPALRLDLDPSARMADAQIRGWEEVWARSLSVGH